MSSIYSYIVSEDIYLLLQKWAKQRDFILPSQDFFSQLREEMVAKLSQMFNRVELISEETLQQGLNGLLKINQLPVISLDRIYVESEYNLELTRVVNRNGEDQGIQNRGGTPSLMDQLQSIRQRMLVSDSPTEVILVDDVIFSGNLLLEVIGLLKKEGIKVAHVYAGIGVVEGMEKIRKINIPVSCVIERDNVIDEVCERDFYPGIPLSGRLLMGTRNIGLPYILPYGQPGKWASIPEEFWWDFSEFCWSQTRKIFSEIERFSGKPVLCRDLDRLVLGLPTNGIRFIDVMPKADAFSRYEPAPINQVKIGLA